MNRMHLAVAVLALGAGATLAGFAATAHSNDADVKQVFSQALPNVPGKVLSAVVVNYAPGGKVHHG